MTIYLDDAASTPLDPRVASKMQAILTGELGLGNPASVHPYGRLAAEAVETARAQVAALLGAKAREITFTSGATEANNTLLKGVAWGYRHTKRRHIVTSQIEHKSILGPCQWLTEQGFEVTYVAPNAQGEVEPEHVCAALRPDTLLVSIQHANNETGVIHDIVTMGQALRARGIFFHVDACQTLGKLPWDVRQMPVDALSCSAHKLYGPKGVGALFVSQDVPLFLQPSLHGGAQEGGMRAGTVATHQVVGMGEACHLAMQEMISDRLHVQALGEILWQGLRDRVRLHGAQAKRLPGIYCVQFLGDEANRLAGKLAISRGSACDSVSTQPSHVLLAMGLGKQDALSSWRISFGRFTKPSDIGYVVQLVSEPA